MYGKLPVTGPTLVIGGATGLAAAGLYALAVGLILVFISAIGVRGLWRRGVNAGDK